MAWPQVAVNISLALSDEGHAVVQFVEVESRRSLRKPIKRNTILLDQLTQKPLADAQRLCRFFDADEHCFLFFPFYAYGIDTKKASKSAVLYRNKMRGIDGPSSLRKPVKEWFQYFRSSFVPRGYRRQSDRW